MESAWVRKGGEVRRIHYPSLGDYLKEGWEQFTPPGPPVPPARAVPPTPRDPSLRKMLRGAGEVCYAPDNLVDRWREMGWRLDGEPAAAAGSPAPAPAPAPAAAPAPATAQKGPIKAASR